MFEASHLQQYPVLVVDDDLAAQEELADALRDYGFNVFEACDGEDAIVMSGRIRPKFIVMDFQLPGLSGLQTIYAMKEFLPDSHYIVITGMASAFCELAAFEHNELDSVLPKPLDVERLAALIFAQLSNMVAQAK